MAEGTGRRARPTLKELVELVETSDNPDRQLLSVILERIRDRDPEDEATVRLAAIPRRFDATILAVLRDEPVPSERTQQLLARLREFSFVRARQRGDVAYDETTRELLLADWRATPASLETFRDHNRQLAGHYSSRHREALRLEQDLSLVADVVRQANPTRYTQLVTTVEQRQIEPLLEALYHETLISPDDGFRYFATSFQQHESLGRLNVCSSLVGAATDYFTRLPADAHSHRWTNWFKYYEARHASQLRDYARAEKILLALRDGETDDKRLRLWALSELGSVYRSWSRFREARDIFAEELELAVSSREDPYNIPASHFRLGDIDVLLGETDAAVRTYRDGIRCAEVEKRTDVELLARLGLSAVLRDRGDFDEAIQIAIDVVDAARSGQAADRVTQQAVCRRLMNLLVRCEPRIADTVVRELDVVGASIVDPVDRPTLEEYAFLLRDSGQLRRAAAAMDLAEKTGPAADLTDRLLGRAILLERAGQLADAAALYGRILEQAGDPAVNTWEIGAALTNRGVIHRDRGDYAAAASDLRRADELWLKAGHFRHAALARCVLADTQRIAARVGALETRLETLGPSRQLVRHYLLGERARHRAEWNAAREHFAGVEAECRVAGWSYGVAFVGGRQALIAAEQGRWADAAAAAAAAATAWRSASGGENGSEFDDLVVDPVALREAQAVLDSTAAHMDGQLPSCRADYYRVRGAILKDLGRWDEAYDAWRITTESMRAIDELNDTAVVLIELALLSARRGRLDDAREASAEAAVLWRRLADRDAYQPTPDRILADEENARGLRELTIDADRNRRLRSARDLFLSAAQRCPDHWWYGMNLAYATAELWEWAEAAAVLENVLATAPAWLRPTALARRLVAYRLRHADGLAAAGTTPAAATVAATAQRDLDAIASTDSRAAGELCGLWQALGDVQTRLDALATAAACYRRALDLADFAGSSELRSGLHLRLGLLAANRREGAAATAHLRIAYQLSQAGEARGFTVLLQHLPPVDRSDRYHALAETLRGLLRDPALSAEEREDLITACLDVNRKHYRPSEWAGHRRGQPSAASEAPSLLPVVTPIAVEAHPSLFPPGEDWAREHPLFDRIIPAMRRRVEADLAVRIPGVRVRPSDTDAVPGGYTIYLDEAAMASGSIQPSRVFVRDLALARRLLERPIKDAEPAPDPSTSDHNDGGWVEREDVEGLPAGAVDVWDPFEYMIHHLESVVRQHIVQFFGVQELENLLEGWTAADLDTARARASMVAAALPTLDVKIRYLAVLQALLGEGVSIADQEKILEAFRAAGPAADPVVAAEAVRRELMGALPGRGESQTFLRLDDALEQVVADGIVRERTKRTLILPPEAVQALIAALRDGIGDRRPGTVTLVTQRPGVRPFVRRLAAANFQNVHVLAEEELPEPVRTRTDGVIRGVQGRPA